VAGLGLALVTSCRRSRGDVFLTYFDRNRATSVRYPSSWESGAASEGGMAYRHFLAPGQSGGKSALSASLLDAPLSGSLLDYANSVAAGAKIEAKREETRGGAGGLSLVYSKDGRRYGIVLVEEQGHAHGFYVQGEEGVFERQRAVVDEMMASFNLERASTYPVQAYERFGYALRVPPSWRESRKMSSSTADTSMVQLVSPPAGVDRDRSTVHVSLTIASEPVKKGGLEEFYSATREKLGDAYKVTSHAAWREGYLDTESIETPVAMSRAKRFYRVAGGRGYTLTFEAREDVFYRLSAWCDLIASTFEVLSSKAS
jgi:hypothetical protein